MSLEQRTETRIERLAAGGDGVGRLPDGRVLFVPFTAPGDRVRVRVLEARRRFARGEVEEILEPGPGRAEPACPVFGECGGCRWQHLAYPVQLEAKRAILVDAVERIAGLPVPGPVAMTPSPAPYGYRLRARVLARGARVGYRRWRSHELCAVSHCPVLTPELDEALSALATRIGRDGVQEAEGASREEREEEREEEWELVAGHDRARALRVGTAAPREPVELHCGEDVLRLSPFVFAQGNALLLRELRDAVVGAATSGLDPGERAVEIHAGAGLFSLPLARHFARLDAVEASIDAARDLEHNLKRSGVGTGWRIHAVPAEKALAALAAEGPAPAVVVLDPPRVGVSEEALSALLALAPRRIAYLSCDPATLARDLRRLCGAGGYVLRSLSGFDLFPQTAHVEALAVSEREGPGPPAAAP